MGTAGEPTTVRAIWDRYGELCSQYAKQYGVPVELIVATIAAESGGNPTARRQEPKIGDESVGLMQTLVKTAQGVLGRNISGDQLLSPELSIEAGTACIAKKLGNTHFDPPMVAAAYNAGSIIFDGGELNRWKLLCYPTGTGQHIDRYVAFFSDCMRVNTAGEWTIGSGVPNFVTALAKKGLDE
ncbi:transglycosylase SLT domain-containing protein [Pseudomonas sp. TE12234]